MEMCGSTTAAVPGCRAVGSTDRLCRLWVPLPATWLCRKEAWGSEIRAYEEEDALPETFRQQAGQPEALIELAEGITDADLNAVFEKEVVLHEMEPLPENIIDDVLFESSSDVDWLSSLP